MYTLRKSGNCEEKGLFLVEMNERMLRKGISPNGFGLTKPRIGCQGWIDFSRIN